MIDITEPSPELLLELSIMLQKGGIPAVKDAEQYMRKNDPGSLKKTDIQAAFIRRLSGYVTGGIIRLTVEKVKSTEEFQKSLKDSSSPYTVVLEKLAPLTLPEYSPYIDIAIKSGTAVVWRTNAAFVIRPLVTLRNTRITLQERKLKEFKFGALNAAMSIYLKKDLIKEELHSFQRDLTIPGFMIPPGT
jgi:hypothetical protein